MKPLNGSLKLVASIVGLLVIFAGVVGSFAYLEYHSNDVSIHHTERELTAIYLPREIYEAKHAELTKDLDEIKAEMALQRAALERIERKLDRR